MTGRLRSLADQATPPDGVVRWQNQDALDALAEHGPEMARLLADMVHWLDMVLTQGALLEADWRAGDALLARFRELEERAQ